MGILDSCQTNRIMSNSSLVVLVVCTQVKTIEVTLITIVTVPIPTIQYYIKTTFNIALNTRNKSRPFVGQIVSLSVSIAY